MAQATVDDLLRRYRSILVEMDAARVESGGSPRKWNRLVDRLQSAQLQLRVSPEGRAGISRLVDDPVRTVREWASAHALFWDEDRARASLEALAAGEGLGAFEARIVLREFDAGRLHMDWEPKR